MLALKLPKALPLVVLIIVNLQQKIQNSLKLAARLGLEPRYHAPEACVLPLDDLAICSYISIFINDSLFSVASIKKEFRIFFI